MLVKLCFHIIVIFSSYYLLNKNNILSFNNKKIIIACLFYVIMSILPITHINLIDQGFSFLILIITMMTMSNKKIQAFYYALIIFIIKYCISVLDLNLQLFCLGYISWSLLVDGLLLMIIIFVLDKYHFIQYSQSSLVYNVVCLTCWTLIARSFAIVDSKNPLYITISYLLGWIFINKVISICNEKSNI